MHKEPEHNCPHCPLQFRQATKYRKHVSACESRKIPCHVCGKKFKSYKCAANHAKSWCKNISKNCTICGRIFAGADELMNHKVCIVLHDNIGERVIWHDLIFKLCEKLRSFGITGIWYKLGRKLSEC